MKNRKRLIIIGVSALTVVAAFFSVLYLNWYSHYRDLVYPGVSLGDIELGGKTLSEARELISERINIIEKTGITFQYNSQAANMPTVIGSFDSGLSSPALYFDIESSLGQIYGSEDERSFGRYLLSLLVSKENKKLSASYNLYPETIRSYLKESFKGLNIEPENASFSVSRKNGSYSLIINPEKPGKEIDYELAFEILRKKLDTLNNSPVDLKTRSKYPSVRESDISSLRNEAEKMLERGDLTLELSQTDQELKKWSVGPDKIISWISIKNVSANPELFLDQAKIQDFLKTSLAPEIDVEAELPRFEIQDGRVHSWETGKNGLALDVEATALKLTADYLAGKNSVQLITRELTTEAITADNDLNIKEIIGTGHSRFAGSPTNRRHNIKVGADSLHGLLIKPGDEFSLLKALGNIDGETGYLPELVIKGNKTVPEYGGGLCQIGTTVFRTALASGLPITMRQNHSYRVSYYEPAGTDATIYDPLPDFRFINDTGNYILIQARIAKDDLYFDFWGVKDGRVATTTEPTIYNIVKPEPTKIVETEDLKPGQKKCTESSHNGADAYFDYKVVYPEGATTTLIQERRFKSHYIPWQAVCLVGKEKAASSTPETQIPGNTKATGTPVASSTPQN